MKISINDLRKMILEQDEENQPVSMADASTKVRLSMDSVDDQIDSHMIDFEASSIVSSDDLVTESLSNLNLSAFLFEQDENLAPEDPGVEDPVGSEDIDVSAPVEPAKRPAMNIDSFTKKVAQLALGYRARLDIPTVIINRAINFLDENYDQGYIDEFKNILDTNFDFNIAPIREPASALAGGREPGIGAIGDPEGLPATGGD
tara:strand:- start:243 stop:851 length:609 start_codon:yes stop_codon:yes gene_type:complete